MQLFVYYGDEGWRPLIFSIRSQPFDWRVLVHWNAPVTRQQISNKFEKQKPEFSTPQNIADK